MKHRQFTSRNWRHMTIVEIIVAMAILSVLMYVLSLYLSSTQVLWRETTARSRMFEQARLVLDVISRDVQGIVISNVPNKQVNYYVPDFAYLGGATFTENGFSTATTWPELKMAMVSTTTLGVIDGSDSSVAEVGYLWYGACNSPATDSGKAKRYKLYRLLAKSSDGGDFDYLNSLPTTWGAPGSWGSADDDAVLADGVYSLSITPYSTATTPVTNISDSMAGLKFVRVELQMFNPALLGDASITAADLPNHLDTFVKLIFVNR